jgi:hypothetical protein
LIAAAGSVLVFSFCAYGQDFDEARAAERKAERMAKFRGVDDDSPGARPFKGEGRRGWRGEGRQWRGQDPERRRIHGREGCEKCRKDRGKKDFRERARKMRRYAELKKKHPKLAKAIKKRAVRKRIRERFKNRDRKEVRERRPPERLRERRGQGGDERNPRDRLEHIEKRIGEIKGRMERLQQRLERGREGKGL